MFLAIGFLMFTASSFAQNLELEKTYDISGASEVGDIANFEYDDIEGTYRLTYILEGEPGKVRVEEYLFDRDFNFLEDIKDEYDIHSAKEKYPWWEYEEDTYSTSVIYVDEKDRLYIRQKDLIFTYNWKKMIYSVKEKPKETLKLENEEEGLLFHYRNWWRYEDDDNIYLLCGVRSEDDDLAYTRHFCLLKINGSMQTIKKTELTFEYPQEVVFPRYLDDETDSREVIMKNEIVCLFAPKNAGRKGTGPDPAKYTYLLLNDDLDILDRVEFSSISAFWSVFDYIYDSISGACYLMGASLNGGPGDYFTDLKSSKKFDGFQIMKIANHNVEYIKKYSINAILAKKVMPPSEKRTNSFEGKKFKISAYTLTPEGKLFIAGQNFDVHRNPQTPGKYTTFEDCFALAFDQSGDLQAEYTFNFKGFGSNLPAIQECYVGKNSSKIYWLIMVPVYTKIDIWGGFGPSWLDIVSSEISKVDLSANTMTDFINHQVNKEQKKRYYLSSKMPYFVTPDDKLVLFGSQSMSGGKRLWFARIPLD